MDEGRRKHRHIAATLQLPATRSQRASSAGRLNGSVEPWSNRVGRFPTGNQEMIMASLSSMSDDRPAFPAEQAIHAGGTQLWALLDEPDRPLGIVVLVHGTGVTRHDPRHRAMATTLRGHGLSTVGIDLLDDTERRDPYDLFDVDLQSLRLVEVSRWVRQHLQGAGIPVGYLASGLGSSIALCAAARDSGAANAIVVAGGRPDAARFWLPKVNTPTLFIVDAADEAARYRAEDARARIAGESEVLHVRPTDPYLEGASPATATARMAADWFLQHFGRDPTRAKAGPGTQ
jgi:predicted alpha/beta-hydrolase family hydrolase